MIEIIRYLLKCGADINAQSNEGMTPLMRSVSHYSEMGIEMTKVLLDEGQADIDLANEKGNTALMFVKSPKIVQLLCDYGCNKEHINKRQQTALL